jgi:cell division initiation protein
MIDLTPLDVRNKRSDFKKALRGYEPQEVDVFLEMVAERLEAIVRENIQLRERAEMLQQQESSSSGRERAVQEALVTAQELRADIRAQAQREAELVLQEAQAEARRRLEEVERKRAVIDNSLAELERRRMRFLKSFRQLLERELDGVEVEEGRAPLEEQAIEMHLGGGHRIEVYEPGMEDVPARGDDLVEDAVEDGPHDEDALAGTGSQEGEEPTEPIPGEDRWPWDRPVHELARRHREEEESSGPPPPQGGGGLFTLPDLPALEDSDDTGRP